MKKIGLLLIILALPVLIFVGCKKKEAVSQQQTSESNYLRFAWWGNPTRDAGTLEMIKLFEQKNPGVTVEGETAGFGGYWDNLAAQAAAGNLPDVMQMDYAYIAQYNSRNQLVDLQPFAQRGLIDLSDWSDAGLSGGRLEGKLVGLNLGVNAFGIEVDTAVVQQAGVTINDTVWTWRDFENIALQIYQRTGIQTIGFGDNIWYQFFENISRYFDSPMYAADGRSLAYTNNTAALAGIKELFDVFLRLKAAGALYDVEDSVIAGQAMPEVPLSQGKTWNHWAWSNQHVGYVNAANRPLEFYLCPAPTATGFKAPYGTYLKPSMLISMLSAARDKDLAARFINFFVNDNDAGRVLPGERGVPIPTHIMTDLTPRVDGAMRQSFDFIAKATPLSSAIDPPDPARAGEARGQMLSHIVDGMLGRINSEEAVARTVRAANAVLSR